VEDPVGPRVTLVIESVQARPVGGDIPTARLTVPVKPWSGVTVIIDVPLLAASVVTLVDPAETVKSWTVKVRVAEWDRPLLVPETVTVYTPALPIQESAEVPELVMLVGVIVHANPVVGETIVERLTTPAKP